MALQARPCVLGVVDCLKCVAVSLLAANMLAHCFRIPVLGKRSVGIRGGGEVVDPVPAFALGDQPSAEGLGLSVVASVVPPVYAARFVSTMFWPNDPRPCFKREMVGPIKSLTDLRRIEAAVRVTCNECGHVRMIDREVLIKHCSFHRVSLDWGEVRAGL